MESARKQNAPMSFSPERNPPTGVLILDKPPGVTSTRCVSMIKRLFPRGFKVGHAGTLDSFATGVLLVMIGKATRSCETLMALPKEYEATIKLGRTTATNDPESPEQPHRDIELRAVDSIFAPEIISALAAFQGEILQRPPDYSALKIAGRRSSDRVRAGEAVRPESRRVRIDRIELLDWSPPLMRIRVNCGRGTYIRSIARDLGEALRVGGYVIQLRRTRIGDYAAEWGAHPESLDLASLLTRLHTVRAAPEPRG